jgi:hypothetical protein
VPLISVLEDIRDFMTEYPSESVWIMLTPDYSPINADYLGTVNFKRANRRKIVKPTREDLVNLVAWFDSILATEERAAWVHREKLGDQTCLAEVRGKIVCFVSGH